MHDSGHDLWSFLQHCVGNSMHDSGHDLWSVFFQGCVGNSTHDGGHDLCSFFQGRGGLGNIYVWATGNGGMHGDDCNADGYTSSVETLSVGSITDWGRQPFYMENCSSTLAVVPTGGEEYEGQEEDMGQIKLKVVSVGDRLS